MTSAARRGNSCLRSPPTAASAIGLTTLVSSQAGDTLLDSQTETDYLEAD